MEHKRLNQGMIDAPFMQSTTKTDVIDAGNKRALLGPGALIRGLLAQGVQENKKQADRASLGPTTKIKNFGR